MIRFYKLARDGRTPVPCDPDEFARWLHGADRVVACTTTPSWEVSTVFLGIPAGAPHDPPYLWESMIFVKGKDCERQRYTSYDDAAAGHTALVEALTSSG